MVDRHPLFPFFRKRAPLLEALGIIEKKEEKEKSKSNEIKKTNNACPDCGDDTKLPSLLSEEGWKTSDIQELMGLKYMWKLKLIPDNELDKRLSDIIERAGTKRKETSGNNETNPMQ